jgi:hypothetical protein
MSILETKEGKFYLRADEEGEEFPKCFLSGGLFHELLGSFGAIPSEDYKHGINLNFPLQAGYLIISEEQKRIISKTINHLEFLARMEEENA